MEIIFGLIKGVFILFVLIALLLAIPAFIVQTIRKRKRDNAIIIVKQKAKEIINFNVNKELEANGQLTRLLLDEQNSKICLIEYDLKSHNVSEAIYNFNDIVKYDMKIDDQSIISVSETPISDTLFYGAAVMNARDRRIIKQVKRVRLIITLNKLLNPIIEVNFYNGPLITTESKYFKVIEKSLDSWLSALNVIIHRNSLASSNNKTPIDKNDNNDLNCNQCGSPIKLHQKFCDKCGYKLF